MAFTESGKIFPRTGHAGHDRLSAELAVGPDFAATRVTSLANDRSWSDDRVDGLL